MTLAALIGLGVWEMRVTAAASMVAAPMFAASLAILWPALAPGRSLVLLALALSPASFAALGLSTKPLIDMVFRPQMTIAEPDASTCRTVSDVAAMARLPKGRVMAPIDLGPMILAATDHAVFAAPYHRNNDGMVAQLRLMLAPHAGGASNPEGSPRRLRGDLLRSDRGRLRRNSLRTDWRRGSAAAKRLISSSRSTSIPAARFLCGGCAGRSSRDA